MEDFVTIEIAKKLKEKGYNGRTDGRHVEKVPGTEREEWDDAEMMYVTVTDVVTTPRVRIWDALEWLREEREIYVAIDFFRFNGNTELWWTYTVRYIEDDSTEDIFESCKRISWEQAALAGIEYVLDNLI